MIRYKQFSEPETKTQKISPKRRQKRQLHWRLLTLMKTMNWCS